MSMVAYFIFCHFFSLSIPLVEIYAYSNSSFSSFTLTIILYSTVWSYTNLLIHSQVDEYLGCFQLFSYYRQCFSEHSFTCLLTHFWGRVSCIHGEVELLHCKTVKASLALIMKHVLHTWLYQFILLLTVYKISLFFFTFATLTTAA